MSAGNGLNPSDAGDWFSTSHYDIVQWDYFTLEWKALGHSMDWDEALTELGNIREAAKSLVRGNYRLVKVESIHIHTDMTVLAERELGV